MSGQPNFSLEIGVAWVVAAKNSLMRMCISFLHVNKFFGKKNNFANLETRKNTNVNSKIVAENLFAIDARLAFIKSESDEKLRRIIKLGQAHAWVST